MADENNITTLAKRLRPFIKMAAQEMVPVTPYEHHNLSGLASDDHTQYVHNTTARTITAVHTFDPTSATAPFIIAADGQGQTVTGLKADQLNKAITAGAGLTGGGNLTGDVSLAVGAGTLISIGADTVDLANGTAQYQVPFTGGSPFTPAWSTSSNNPTDIRILRSDAAGKLQLAGLGIGVAQHATIPLYIHSATEQARFRYDVDNYFSIICGAGAATTLKTTGTGVSGSMVFDPMGNLITSPDGKNILPDTTYDVNIGSPLKKYLTLYCAELNVETLVAQDVMATIGGRVLVAPTTFLTRDLAEGVYTLYTKHNNLAVNDIIRMEGYGNVEFMQITAGPTASAEVLSNPGFETSGGGGDDVFANWVETKGSGTISKDGTIKHGGSWSCKFAANAVGDTKIVQTITVTANTRYEFNWWQYSAGYMGLYDVSNSQFILPYAYQLPNGNYTSWGFYQRFFTTPIGCTSIRVDFICFVSIISYWDDAHIGLAEYSYTANRNLDGTGENTWYAGDALVNLGIAGDGWIDLYATSGMKAGTQVGPTIVGSVRNSTTFNDWNECWAIGNLQGLYDYAGVAYGAAFGKYAASNSWISVDSTSGVRIMNGTGTPTQLAQWDISGNILIGKSASDNVYITTAGALSIRNGATKRIELTAAGILTVNDGGGNAVITLDASTGAEITKKLTMPGASSAISIGATPPTSATVGTGIWIDRTGMYGLAANVLQAKFDAVTGKITAGAGDVVLDSTGIRITAGDAVINSVSWYEGTAVVAYIRSLISGTTNSMRINSQATGTDASTNIIKAMAESGGIGELTLQGVAGGVWWNWILRGESTGGYVTLTNESGISPFLADRNSVTINEYGYDMNFRVESGGNPNMINVDGGLNCVGIGKVPASGSVLDVSGRADFRDLLVVQGAVHMGTTMIRYPAGSGIACYAFVPLSTPLTSTSWDGDLRSTTAKTLIDLSAVFGTPANIKAVLFRVEISDSAAGDYWFIMGPTNTNYRGLALGVQGLSAASHTRGCLTVPCDANGDVYYQNLASGASTMEVFLEIWGYWI